MKNSNESTTGRAKLKSTDSAPLVSVVMPTFRQAAFLGRAVQGLFAQTFRNWELIVVNDGSPDDTLEVTSAWTADPRVRVLTNSRNLGLGAAINRGLDTAKGEFIAYLPSDDLWLPNHLESLLQVLRTDDAVAAFSGVNCTHQEPGSFEVTDRTSDGQIENEALQLLQVMHRRVDVRWMERDELVTDDLDRMFWSKLRSEGAFVATNQRTCDWIAHPKQHHRLVREPLGGINPYRSWYGVEEPMQFHSSVGSFIDEKTLYDRFRSKQYLRRHSSGLRIVLAGALAFYPERILALAERGHELYGLWAPEDMHWFNTVGPLPFGHVRDLDSSDIEGELARIKPDVIYGMLNYQVVPFVHDVMTRSPEIPLVWHFKEGPFDTIANGTWPLLVDLCTKSSAQIYSSPEMRDWMDINVPGGKSRLSMVIDGDLPPRAWFTDDRSPRLSESQGGIHTVVTGQPLGLTVDLMRQMAEADIHLHMYGDFYRARFSKRIGEFLEVAPDHLHMHPQVTQVDWTKELSQYDAGWLHLLPANNGGDLRYAKWADLNYPARLSTLACAGLPWIQWYPGDSIVATAELARSLNVGLFFKDGTDLSAQLRDKEHMGRLQNNMWNQRDKFTFDCYADRLVGHFREAMNRHSRLETGATGTSPVIDLRAAEQALATHDRRTPAVTSKRITTT